MPLGAYRLGSYYGGQDEPAGRTAKSITVSGNAQISTTQSKFGGSSLYLVNNWSSGQNVGSLWVGSSTGDFTFGTGDYTAECFIYLPTSGAYLTLDMLDINNTNIGFIMYVDGANLVFYESSNVRITASSAVSLNTWHHLATVRNNGSVQMYVDGTAVGSSYSSTKDHQELTLGIGARYSGSGSSNFNGYIDEVRISDTARYTGNFTAPTAAFTNDANTLFLLHADGTNGSTTFTDDNS